MLGIIGGVGPTATARLYMGLMNRFSTRVGGALPELLLHSVRMSPRIENAFLTGALDAGSPVLAETRRLLRDSVRRLASAGAELVTMPCNTLQETLVALCREEQIACVNMVEATADAIAREGARRVLVLGTTTTCRAGTYGAPLRARAVSCVYPEAPGQALVERQIRYALDRRGSPLAFKEYVFERSRDCDAVLIACTDLSGELDSDDLERPVFDSLECLADAGAAWLFERHARATAATRSAARGR